MYDFIARVVYFIILDKGLYDFLSGIFYFMLTRLFKKWILLMNNL